VIDYTWRGVPEHRNSYSDYRLVRERVCALRGRRVARPAAGAAKTAYFTLLIKLRFKGSSTSGVIV
jgi:hypothetical protein